MHRYLAELKGMARANFNEGILISMLSLQEAQSRSDIENIITTQDALYKFGLQEHHVDPITKEVAFNAKTLRKDFANVKNHQAMFLNTILEIQALFEGNQSDFRKTPGFD